MSIPNPAPPVATTVTNEINKKEKEFEFYGVFNDTPATVTVTNDIDNEILFKICIK